MKGAETEEEILNVLMHKGPWLNIYELYCKKRPKTLNPSLDRG